MCGVSQMHSYEIQYTCENSREHRCHRFQADSLARVLELARDELNIDKALLIEDGHPVCSLALVNNTGVWLVGAPAILEA